MAYESYPRVGHNGRAVTSAEFEKIAAPLGLSGLVDYTGTMPILADSSGRQVKLRSGVAASIRGSRFNNTSETIITIGANASGNPRIDLVVLRLSRSDWSITPVVTAGVAAPSPVAPSAVRNTIDGAGGYWDIPLAEVAVANGATTIAAGDVTHRAWWISGSGYVSPTSGKPPVEPGVGWFDTTTSTHWIGTTTGAYLRVASNSGVTSVAPPSGWSGQTYVARENGLVVCSLSVRRTGGNINEDTAVTIATVAEQFRPPVQWFDTYQVTGPDHSSSLRINTDGTIVLDQTFATGQGINTNAFVFGGACWPAATA